MSDARLYTSFDVETVLAKARLLPQWPDCIARLSVYPDLVELTVQDEGEVARAIEAMKAAFGLRFDADQLAILLESLPEGGQRSLPVEVIVDDSSVPGDGWARRFTAPSFSRVSVLPENAPTEDRVLPQLLPNDWPTVLAFYSYKGGVGRTLHLLATLKALCERVLPPKILVIDADLEAPGLTWWARSTIGEPEISLLDLLALARNEGVGGDDTAVAITVQRVRKQPLTVETSRGKVDVFFLPAFREEEQTLRMKVRPEHLVEMNDNQWKVGELFAKLGHQLGVNVVLADLRAGISELASPVLFDPRVRRTLVTSTSRQSLEGTRLVLRQVRKLSPPPSGETLYYDPAVVVSMVPQELAETYIPQAVEQLLESYPNFGDDMGTTARLHVGTSLFAQELLHLEDLKTTLDKLSGTSPYRTMLAMIDDWLPVEEPSTLVSRGTDKRTARAALAREAGQMIVAESVTIDDFLSTASLKALGTKFQDEPPLAVVMGSKGSGKTFAYNQLGRKRLWSRFLNHLGFVQGTDWGYVLPFTHSANLHGPVIETIRQCQEETLNHLGSSLSLSHQEVIDAVRKELQRGSTNESEWRDFWFTLMARALGLQCPETNTGVWLNTVLRNSGHRLVIIMDGLEDIFKDFSSPVHQTAIRALCQDVLTSIRELPHRHLGVLVFVRKDIVRAVFPQNLIQFQSLYEQFELKWNPEEALRLAVWLCGRAGLRGSFVQLDGDIVTAPKELLERAMIGVWGLKLGPAHSREARTSDWVRDALSDFKGQLQARDVVRFLAYAAEESVKRDDYDDRLLQPFAVRNAIQRTSAEKVEEIKVEIERLKEIFAKFEAHRDRVIPFSPASYDLDSSEVQFLEETGIILEDKERREFYMPEIFRSGLGFRLEGGARPKVLSLMRKALGVR